MTRINVIPPRALHSKHLVAEYRELPRVFTLALKAYERGDLKDIPSEYTLGKGHVRFFYNKLEWLLRRYSLLFSQMLSRGYKPNFELYKSIQDNVLNNAPMELLNEWDPSDKDKALNKARIEERLKEKKKDGS